MKFVFLGTQGSGKSTQAKLLAEKINLPYFEMGALIRSRGEESDEIGKKVKLTHDKGNLVPDEITINILKENTKKTPKGYVLDGFPRNALQMAQLDSDVTKVFLVSVSDDEAIKRLKKRKRIDDTKEALAQRLEIYHRQTEPLLENFKNKGILDEIDGERSIQEIHEDILNRVQNLS